MTSEQSSTSLVTAYIDLAAVEHNVRMLRQLAPRCQFMAVVKADGYGHGAGQVAAAAQRAGADCVGVATASEAVSLRREGYSGRLMFWLIGPGEDCTQALTAHCEVAVGSRAALEHILQIATGTGVRPKITIKIDTGLSRNGFLPTEFVELLPGLVDADNAGLVSVQGAMAHFASADEPGNPFNDRQQAVLKDCVEAARAHGLGMPCNHHSNSAAVCHGIGTDLDMVRCGIAIYGLGDFAPAHGLIPAMRLVATVAAVKQIQAGDTVSYGRTWSAEKPTTIALVAAGYADGIPRTLSSHISVTYQGVQLPQLGRICMDQIVVSAHPDGQEPVNLHVGDEVELFGRGEAGGATAASWAQTAGTIDYEIVTGIRGRTRLKYVNA